MAKIVRYCTKCLTPSTRPRVVFNEDSVCNACQWAEKKKSIVWTQKSKELEELCDKFRRKDDFDVIVPCSGGKDGSYVAWKMKHDFGMHPLCVTFSPPIQTELGRRNLDNFRNSGFDLIEIRANPEIYRRLCKRMFVEQARSKFPFVIAIGTAVAQVALKFDVPFIMGGEEGETEYGGSDRYANQVFMDSKYMVQVYHEGSQLREYLDEFSEADLKWWLLPPEEELKKLKITWWSKWESWDDQLHRDLAAEKCGLQTSIDETGTFTNYAQLDDILQDLHMYECFIKFGFGRATADCNLAIKGGRITREEGVELVNKYDGTFPDKYLSDYIEYFEMTEEEFWAVIDSFANTEILKKVDGRWRLKPAMIEGLEKGGDFSV